MGIGLRLGLGNSSGTGGSGGTPSSLQFRGTGNLTINCVKAYNRSALFDGAGNMQVQRAGPMPEFFGVGAMGAQRIVSPLIFSGEGGYDVVQADAVYTGTALFEGAGGMEALRTVPPLVFGGEGGFDVSPASSEFWTPSDDAGLDEYWDASDDTTVSEAVGVDQWSGKTATYILSNSTGAEQPGYDDINKITFDGSGDKLQTTYSTYAKTSVMIGVLFTPLTVAGGSKSVVDQTPGANGLGIRWNSTNLQALGYQEGVGSARLVAANGALSVGQPIIAIVEADANGLRLYLNGSDTPAASTASSMDPIADDTPALFTMGAAADGGQDGDQDIYTLITSTTTGNDDNRQKITGWIAHEFDQTGLLDPGHPYKSTPPTI